ncbi:MAG: M15 family metallopeptidase, partial [Clostridiales bacterium]|nr:M15 family metallopeptidase [Clostridiales bacterium]
CLSICMVSSAFAAEFTDTGIFMLVNIYHRISKDYVPELVYFEDTNYQMNEEAAASLSRMLDDMEEELGEAPMVVSAYRSYERQVEVYNNDVNRYMKSGITEEEAIEQTEKYVALPGASEHQTGLAIDLSNDGSLEEDFIETEAGQWLKDNCYKYGFVVRYPEDKVQYTLINYEPWHIRYVDLPVSQIMYENGWCLEEFVAYMKRNVYMVWYDMDNVWTLTFTDEIAGNIDSNTSVSYTNSGGYIVLSRKSKDSSVIIDGNGFNSKHIMQARLLGKITQANIESEG